MPRVWDEEDQEYLTCHYGSCAEDGDDEFWVPSIHGEGLCHIFCTYQHLQWFCVSRGIEIPETGDEETARILAMRRGRRQHVTWTPPRIRERAFSEPKPSLTDWLTGRATLRQVITGRW